MNKVVVFGNRDMAELAYYYLTNDSNYQVVAFSVHEAYIDGYSFCGLPVVPFERVTETHPPSEYLFYAPIYASGMNRVKEKVCGEIEQKGYEFATYISSKAYTWNAKIGKNAFILEGCNIQPFCEVGDNLVMWSFSHIGHHSKVGNNVFMSGNVVVAGHNVIDDYCFLGTNCSTRDGIHIAESSFIGQDSSVVRNCEPEGGLWVGTPARRLKESKDVEL